jgi:3-mercaptopyruvate sulfurtransferase SseA
LYSSVLHDVDLMCSQHCSDMAVPGCVMIASSSMVDLLSVPEDAQMCMNLFSDTLWLLQDKHIPGAVFFDVDAISDLTSHVSPLTAA